MQIGRIQTRDGSSEHGPSDPESPFKADNLDRRHSDSWRRARRHHQQERGRLDEDQRCPREDSTSRPTGTRSSFHGRRESSGHDAHEPHGTNKQRMASSVDSPSRRGSGGSRPPIKIPYLAQIERRISTDLLDIAGRLDSLKPLPMLIRDLNKETSNYHQLTVGIGGSSDCEQLRDELKRSRQRASDLARQAKTKLLPSLQEPNRYSSNEQKEAGKFCKILFYCIKVLEQEVARSVALQKTFPLQVENQTLINTGVNEFVGTHHRGVPIYQHTDSSSTEKGLIEEAEILALRKEASELWGYLSKIQANNAGSKYWLSEDLIDKHSLHTIFEISDAPASPASPFAQHDSNNSDLESLQDDYPEKVHRRRCQCWFLASLVMTLSVASLLALLISFLTKS